MVTKEDVQLFLDNFKTKLSIWDILYLNRPKNTQSLIDLDIRPIERTHTLNSLEVLDYSEGPLPDTMLNGPGMWVFGVNLKGFEVYIKITLGGPSSCVICISFHIAEFKMDYPFKK